VAYPVAGTFPDVARVTPEELCARYAARVARFASITAGSDADAEDVAQDALLKAIAALDRYDPARGSMDAWLWRIVANTARDATRRARLRALLPQRLIPAARPMDIESLAIERVTTAEIYYAIGRLSPRDRELLALRFTSDLTTAEVGQLVGLSAESARRAIGRALERLRALLVGGAS
jgi:RNA polymerase sigma-70 factor (ECF subfamily)